MRRQHDGRGLRLGAALLASSILAGACGSGQASDTAGSPSTTAPTTTTLEIEAIAFDDAVELPVDGSIAAGTYYVDLLDVRVGFETSQAVWSAPFLNSSAEAFLLAELAEDSGAMARMSRISALRTADEAVDVDRQVGSIPLDELDRWIEENNVDVLDRRDVAVGGLPAVQLDVRQGEPDDPDQARCDTQNSDFADDFCIFVGRLADGADDAGSDWAPWGVNDEPARFWFVDLGDGTHLFIDVRADADWPDWMEQWTTIVRRMAIDLDPEPAVDDVVEPIAMALTDVTEIVDAVIGTFETGEHSAAADALGETGGWVEPDGTEHGSDSIVELFSMYTTIARIDRNGDGFETAAGTYAFSVVDVFDTGTEFAYYLEVYGNAEGHLRIAVRLDEPTAAPVRDGTEESSLSIGAARAIVDALIEPFASGEVRGAELALGESGAWVEPDGSEYGADEIGAFIAGFGDVIEVIERTGPGYRDVDGGYSFPVTDVFFGDRADLDFFLRVHLNDDDELRVTVLGAAPAALTGVESAECMIHADIERCWETIDGSGGDAEAPLLIDLHGWTDAPVDHQLRSSMHALVVAEGVVGVWPIGVGASWNAGPQCCGSASADGVDDVGFLRAMIEELSNTHAFDRDRIYVTGLSNGCAMAQRFAADASDLVAAVACMSHYLLVDPAPDYEPVPVMILHGDADQQVPYVGDGLFAVDGLDAPTNIGTWATHNECVGEPVEAWRDVASRAESYTACSNDAEVTLVTVSGGDHFLYAGQHTDVDTTLLAWHFLRRFTA